MTFVERLLRRATRARRLVLGAALAAGLVFAAAIGDDRIPLQRSLLGDAVAAQRVGTQIAAESKDGAAPAESADTKGKAGPDVDAEISITERGVRIRKNRGGDEPGVVSGDHEFESFEAFVEQAPWLAALVFMVTAMVFLVPFFIVALIIWYKIRSNRMRNETMLKLAERGMPAADAMAAVLVGSAAAQPAPMPSSVPLYEQVKQVRKRAAWSDLRKGVILIAIGLGLTIWSDNGSPNGFGLVVLFVGIGYVVLWYFEERQLTTPRDSGPGTPGGA